MIKQTKQQIINCKPLKNKVIVKITRRPNELVIDEKTKLYLDYQFSHEQHAPTRGIVMAVCDGLNSNLMNWGTINEIQVGDEAVFNYVAAMHCWFDDPDRTLYDDENEMYFVLDYEDFFAVKRNGKLIPVNGYALCEPYIDPIRTSLLLPDSVKTRRSEKLGIVRHVGRPNDFYQLLTEHGPEKRQDLCDAGGVQEGDLIAFARNCDLMIENETHASLAGKKRPLYRINQCYLLATMDNKN